ncbi:MAG: 6-phosphogluconolactonase [Acidobacteriota bacterium]|nr:6-phosphogluconolactonase [Acidobacteriota bacterium]
MPTPEIRTFKDLEDLSRGAAQEFAALSRESPQGSKPFAAALSGGSTPKRFYELLAAPEFAASVAWEQVMLFQVDERAVPPDDPRSNYKMMREALLERVRGVRFFRMAAEQADLESAARDYASGLRAALAVQPAEWPRLDVIYLGMGEDGHTASLFPGTAALSERKLAVTPNYVAKLRMSRLTLTLPVLNAARRVIFLVSGAEKAEMLRRVLRPDNSSPALPSQLVSPANGTVSWYVDEDAASLL